MHIYSCYGRSSVDQAPEKKQQIKEEAPDLLLFCRLFLTKNDVLLRVRSIITKRRLLAQVFPDRGKSHSAWQAHLRSI